MVLEVLGFAAQAPRTTWIPSVAEGSLLREPGTSLLEGPVVGNQEVASVRS